MKIIIVLKPHQTSTLSEYYEDWANWQVIRALLVVSMAWNRMATEVQPCPKS